MRPSGQIVCRFILMIIREYCREGKRITYYMNGKWYQWYTNLKLSSGVYGRANPGYNNSLFGKDAFSRNTTLEPNCFPNIMSVYFQRTELNKFNSSASGGGISDTSKSWDGDLYCQLLVQGDTLKFKKAMFFNENFTTENFIIRKEKISVNLKPN